MFAETLAGKDENVEVKERDTRWRNCLSTSEGGIWVGDWTRPGGSRRAAQPLSRSGSPQLRRQTFAPHLSHHRRSPPVSHQELKQISDPGCFPDRHPSHWCFRPVFPDGGIVAGVVHFRVSSNRRKENAHHLTRSGLARLHRHTPDNTR